MITNTSDIDSTITVDQPTFDCFMLNFENTLRELTFERLISLYLYDKKSETFIISFDKDWKPFIGITRGYNHPGDRTYLKPPIPALYSDIAIAMGVARAFHHCAGGRLFLTYNYCYFKETEAVVSPICKLIWPTRKTAFTGLKEIYSELLKYKMELRNNPKPIEEYCLYSDFPFNILGDTVVLNKKIGEVVEISNDGARFKFRVLDSSQLKLYQTDIVAKKYIKGKMR